MFFNANANENNFKLIVDGSPSEPKAAFVKAIYDAVRADLAGRFSPLPSEVTGEELVMCDMLLTDITIGGAAPRLWLFTVPGWHIGTKREVAAGYDGATLLCHAEETSAIVAAWEKFAGQFRGFAAGTAEASLHRG